MPVQHETGTAEAQRELWGRRPHDWSELQEGQDRPLYEAVIAAAGIGPGTQLLDCGCGSGLFCRMAADVGARVSGYDATPELLEIARERTPDGQFYQGDIQWLPWPDDSFDVVTGLNAFMLAENPVEALREAARVANPGGRVVLAVWGRPELCEAGAALASVARLLPPLEDTPGPFKLFTPGAAEAALEEAGLTPERVEDVFCTWSYRSLETAVRACLSGAVAALAIRHSGDAAVREAVERALAPHMDESGACRLQHVHRLVVARP